MSAQKILVILKECIPRCGAESLHLVGNINWSDIPRHGVAAEGAFRVAAAHHRPHRRGGVLLRSQNFAARVVFPKGGHLQRTTSAPSGL